MKLAKRKWGQGDYKLPTGGIYAAKVRGRWRSSELLGTAGSLGEFVD